jgi:hypothetical protein
VNIKPSNAHSTIGFANELVDPSHWRRAIKSLLVDFPAVLRRQRDKLRLSLDREGVLSRLIAQYEKANAMDSPSAVGPAIKALELLGGEIGMFIERHGAVGDFARMTDDELRHIVLVEIEHSKPGKPAN